MVIHLVAIQEEIMFWEERTIFFNVVPSEHKHL